MATVVLQADDKTGITQYYDENLGYHHPFDSESDATKLRDALRGEGTEDLVIRVLGNRTNEQRQRIMETYKSMFEEDLKRKLLLDLTGQCKKTMELLLMPLAEYYAILLHHAIGKSATNENLLLEILCTITNTQILQIKEIYLEKYSKTLEEAISDDTNAEFKHLLLMICKASRNEGVVCLEKVRADAEALFEAGEAQWGTDEGAFNALFAFESYEHLRFVFQEYEDITGRSLFEAIEAETSGDLRRALLTIVRCVENTPAYFARKLYKAFKGQTVDERSVMRIVVSRCEIDMVFIKSEYEKRFKEKLEHAIQRIITGDFAKLLVVLVTN